MPFWTMVSSTRSTIGLPKMGTIALLRFRVMGCSREPRPAARITAGILDRLPLRQHLSPATGPADVQAVGRRLLRVSRRVALLHRLGDALAGGRVDQGQATAPEAGSAKARAVDARRLG